MAESLGSHQALLGPSSHVPQEGRHFFDIREIRGHLPEKPLATVSLCRLRLVLGLGHPALVCSWGKFTPHPSCALHLLSHPQLLLGGPR